MPQPVDIYVTNAGLSLQVGTQVRSHAPDASDDFRRGGQDLTFSRNASGGVSGLRIAAAGVDGILFVKRSL